MQSSSCYEFTCDIDQLLSATSGAGTAHPSGTPEINPDF